MLNAMFVLSLAAILGTGMAFTSTAEETDIGQEVSEYHNFLKGQSPEAISLNEDDPLEDRYYLDCHIVWFDMSTYPSAHGKEYCNHFWDGYHEDYVSIYNLDKAYKIGDLLDVEIVREQGYDPYTYETIYSESEYALVGVVEANKYELGEVVTEWIEIFTDDLYYDVLNVVIELDDDRFNAGECYAVHAAFKSPLLELRYGPAAQIQFCIAGEFETDYPPSMEPEPEPRMGVQGKIYRDSNGNEEFDAGESGMSGLTVLAINMADFDDVSKSTADRNGDYLIELEAGRYLVQVEGTNHFAYLTIHDGSITTHDFGI